VANLFKHAKRIEQRKFFSRLDMQWGKGLRQRTNPDHCPLRGYAQEPSKLAPCEDMPLTTENRPSNQAQTLVLSQHKLPGKVTCAGLGTFSDAPSPTGSPELTSYPWIELEKAPTSQPQGNHTAASDVAAVLPEPRFYRWPSRVPVW
jgi:hypothetical protein